MLDMSAAVLPQVLRPAPDFARVFPALPPQIVRLPFREREVASIVYREGVCTAKQVQALLSTSMSNGAVRSMLVRLVKKGHLARNWGQRGRGHQFLYFPAESSDVTKMKVLEKVAVAFFNGSLSMMASELTQKVNGTTIEGEAAA